MCDPYSFLYRIEQQRQDMYRLAAQYGLADQRVLDKSKQLDNTLNEYSRCQAHTNHKSITIF
ncbi:aspartyl-phosphate phosphatase Spo0E family protein [Paenibacillus campi]|uniref:aspartyl-phosphate phosphatase Spo0E family protein n=1 Tax=Paenibacillus campi TaxID=3106031 RepID=UPI002AFEA9B9|nr:MULTISPECIES: aspartyl-phosphate phosphatase Spo0E family protein [unclassified Paenibacillus]